MSSVLNLHIQFFVVDTLNTGVGAALYQAIGGVLLQLGFFPKLLIKPNDVIRPSAMDHVLAIYQ